MCVMNWPSGACEWIAQASSYTKRRVTYQVKSVLDRWVRNMEQHGQASGEYRSAQDIALSMGSHAPYQDRQRGMQNRVL